MSTKWTLNIAAMQEEFFSDRALIGIASSLPVYQFCWLINQKFDLNFVRDADSDILFQNTDENAGVYFPIYTYSAPLNGIKYLIYKLKSDNMPLLPEVKQLDYLWMIQSNSPESDAMDIANNLKSIKEIQLAQLLFPEKLKNLSYLIV